MTRTPCRRSIYRGALLVAAALLSAVPAAAADSTNPESGRTQAGAVFVCDSIASGKPQGRSIVFPAVQGTLYCFSDFGQVAAPEQTTHRWFFRDREVAQFRLAIQPPRWSSYSSLKIPPDSTGPWRVEVLGQDGRVYGVARFSMLK